MIDAAARERIVLCAHALMGVPYVWGGNTPKDGGLDCSGFAQWVLAVAGAEPWASDFPTGRDDTAAGLWVACEEVGLDEHPLPGDLAFYGREGVSHVVVVSSVTLTQDGGHVYGVIGAGRGDRTCATPADAMSKGARVRTYPSHDYRPDFRGFRRPWLRGAA